MSESSIQHPVLRIQGLVTELKDATTGVDFETEKIHEMLDELESILLMVATRGAQVVDWKLARYEMISRIVNAPDPNRRTGDADTDAESGRGDHHRGSGDGRGPGDERDEGPPGDNGSPTVQGDQGGAG